MSNFLHRDDGHPAGIKSVDFVIRFCVASVPQSLARNVAQGLRILGEAQLAAKSRGTLKEYYPGTSFRPLEAPARRGFSRGRAPDKKKTAQPISIPDVDVSSGPRRRKIFPGTSFRHLEAPARQAFSRGRGHAFESPGAT